MVDLPPFTILFFLGLPALAAQIGPGTRPGNGYVDSKLCATCHREIAANYARTGMGRSFFAPGTGNTIEDYAKTPEYYHALSDSHYSMTVRNGQYFQRRWQLDAGGNEINAEEVKIDYVMGSGNHARSYLHRTERGMLIELPLGWYPDKGGGWGMVPGSDTQHAQTSRFVSYKCMFCHDGYPNIPAANQAPGSEPVFLGELPEGIDCQRCHGPGGVYAVPPRNHQRAHPGGAPAIRPGHVLVYAWTALDRFRDRVRPRAGHRARRQIRGGKLGLQAAAIALFRRERRKIGMRHLSRSASDSARRGSGGAVFRSLCAMPFVSTSGRRNDHRCRLHYVSHAEAPGG